MTLAVRLEVRVTSERKQSGVTFIIYLILSQVNTILCLNGGKGQGLWREPCGHLNPGVANWGQPEAFTFSPFGKLLHGSGD